MPPTTLHPLMFDRLPNDYPVYLETVNGVAHAPDADVLGAFRTRCNIPTTKRGRWLTLIQVHVWLQRAFCGRCFATGGS